MYDPNSGTMPARRGRSGGFWIAIGIGIAAIVAIALVFVLLANGVIGSNSGPRPGWGVWGGFLLVFLIVWIAFFVIRIALWTGRRGSGYGGYGRYGGPHRDPAVMAARQRYARGEITREQFDQIMTDLGRRGRGPGGPLSGS